MVSLYGWASVTWAVLACFLAFYLIGYFQGRKEFTPKEKRGMIIEIVIWGFFVLTGIYPIFFGG